MVTFSKASQRRTKHRPVAVAAVLFGCLMFLLSDRNESSDYWISQVMSQNVLLESGRQEIKDFRRQLRDQCSSATTQDQVKAVADINKSIFKLPTSAPRRHLTQVKQCKNVVLDFGANIGDTAGKFIDAGLVGCRPKDLTSIPDPLFDTEAKQFVDASSSKKKNRLAENFGTLISDISPTMGPEDYCYYGVEGNPVFTKKLQELENFVMDITPRPLEHIHFFTESVGAGQDGMTKLYLDMINSEQNFWGSSIMENHQDVRKTKNATNTTMAADVTGYTLGTLMRQSLVAFSPMATAEDKKGGHFVLKVDIEGGEFPLLMQAVEEGTLCEYVKMGNKADLFIEFHSQRVTGAHAYLGKKKTIEAKLTECGVTNRNLGAFWN